MLLWPRVKVSAFCDGTSIDLFFDDDELHQSSKEIDGIHDSGRLGLNRLERLIKSGVSKRRKWCTRVSDPKWHGRLVAHRVPSD
jgi:hypothetical protein